MYVGNYTKIRKNQKKKNRFFEVLSCLDTIPYSVTLCTRNDMINWIRKSMIYVKRTTRVLGTRTDFFTNTRVL